MRQMIRRQRLAAFTLIELLLAVAVVGTVAVLALFGVRKYLGAAKAAEATSTISLINRAAIAAYQRDSEGPLGITTHQLCKSSTAVPTTVPARTRYLPTPTDYHVPGEAPDTGWTCLHWELNEPHYYQFKYDKDSKSAIASGVTYPGRPDWVVAAVGDLNGDGETASFVTGGELEPDTGRPMPFVQMLIANPEE
jgi:type IV pilus assembly protein PilA